MVWIIRLGEAGTSPTTPAGAVGMASTSLPARNSENGRFSSAPHISSVAIATLKVKGR